MSLAGQAWGAMRKAAGDMRRHGGPVRQKPKNRHSGAWRRRATKDSFPPAKEFVGGAAVPGLRWACWRPAARAWFDAVPPDHAVAAGAGVRAASLRAGRSVAPRLAAFLAPLPSAGRGRPGAWQLATAGAAAGHHALRRQPQEAGARSRSASTRSRRLRELPRQNLPALLQAMVLLPLFLWAVYVIARDKLRRLPGAAAAERGEPAARVSSALAHGAVLEGRGALPGVRRGGPGPPDAPLQAGPADEQAGNPRRDARNWKAIRR